MNGRILFCFSLAALSFFSCSVVPPAQRETAKAPALPPETVRKPGAELDSAVFKQLPPGSREYLASIAEAAASGNADHLLAQGERDYSRRVRPAVDRDTYAALLYRIGDYSRETPIGAGGPSRADLGRASGMRFTGWEENGPVLEVRARLRFKDGTEQPCALYVLWKLSPPQILGAEP